MKKTAIQVAIILLFSTSFIQCTKEECKSDKLGDINFSQADLNIVKYNGTETFMFKDSSGFTIPFFQGSKGSVYEPVYKNHVTSPSDCPGDYYDIEEYFIQFKSAAGFITIYLGFSDPFSSNIEKKICINVDFMYSQEWSFGSTFVFDNLKLYSSSSPSANGSILAFNDSLKVGPNMFYSVYTLKQSNPKGGLLNLQIVYYNVSDGIIGFKTDQGHLWFLSN